jgi:hypothetical protein
LSLSVVSSFVQVPDEGTVEVWRCIPLCESPGAVACRGLVFCTGVVVELGLVFCTGASCVPAPDAGAGVVWRSSPSCIVAKACKAVSCPPP